MALIESLREIAGDKHATVAQLAIAWVLSRGNDMIPLVGARKPSQLKESLGALELELTPIDLARIDEAVPSHRVAGEYYPVSREKWFVSDTVH